MSAIILIIVCLALGYLAGRAQSVGQHHSRQMSGRRNGRSPFQTAGVIRTQRQKTGPSLNTYRAAGFDVELLGTTWAAVSNEILI